MNAQIESLGRDLRVALRGLLRRPTFTFAVVLTLALGIGANTAIFTVVNSVLLKPLSYPRSDELVSLNVVAPGLGSQNLQMGRSLYFTFREHSRAFEGIGFYSDGGQSVTGQGEPEQARALFVTASVLPTLGVQPMLGRAFTQSEDEPNAEGAQPVILTYAYWRRKFGGDEAVIGRNLSLDGRPSQVVGVMPPRFRFLDLTPEIEVILLLHLDSKQAFLGDLGFGNAIARLKPGVTLADAATDVERMLPIWLESWPEPTNGMTRETFRGWRLAPALRPLKESVVGGVSNMLWILMIMIGGVLLIACANVANLMLVRADVRRQEFAVRAALGARPARLVRDLLLESLVLGAGGGVLGLALAYAGLGALVAMGPANLPRLQEIGFDPFVLAFALGASIVSALLFGCLPALKLAARAHAPVTGNAARGASTTRERHRARNALVVVQVALSLVLLVSSGLMIRTFLALRNVDPGFTNPETIQVARIWMGPVSGGNDPKSSTQTQREIADRIAALPGVASVAFGLGAAMEPNRSPGGALYAEGQTYAEGERPQVTRYKFVSPGYLETLGTRLLAGRELAWQDIDNGGEVAVISENVAREIWGSPAAALGKRIRETAPTSPTGVWREVIGVAQDVYQDALDRPAPPTVYWPVLTESFLGRPGNGTPAIAYVVRSERAGSDSFARELRQAVWSVNADLPVFLVRTVQDLYAASYARTSFVLVLLVIAGGLALSLGVIGIYGVMAYVVSQRQREIGIRLALGAQPDKVKTMFVLHGLTLAGAGILAGLVAAVALTRLLASLLFGVGPLDVPAYAAGLVVIMVAATFATWLPARRAATIDPVVTLRAE